MNSFFTMFIFLSKAVTITMPKTADFGMLSFLVLLFLFMVFMVFMVFMTCIGLLTRTTGLRKKWLPPIALAEVKPGIVSRADSTSSLYKSSASP